MDWIADSETLARVWRGEDLGYVSSPEEEFCTIFDDLRFEDFVRSSPRLDPDGRALLGKILQLLNRAGDKFGKFIEVEELIANPDWQEAQRLSGEFVKHFASSSISAPPRT